ncbi:MAG: hypothetical protein ABSG71_02680 [Thermodesulfobacteriota bacterium]
MKLNETEVNSYLQPFLGRYEDSFQQAWVEILECNPQTLEEITPIIRRVRNKAIKQYMNKRYREESLYKPIGKHGDETFTLESILESLGNEDTEDRENGDNGLYKKIVDFLMGEYFNQKNENLELRRERDNHKHRLSSEIRLKAIKLKREQLKFKKRKQENRHRRYIANLMCYLYCLDQKDKNLELKRRDIELKAERLRLRQELLKFKRDRFESWKKLMEDKRKQRENQLN